MDSGISSGVEHCTQIVQKKVPHFWVAREPLKELLCISYGLSVFEIILKAKQVCQRLATVWLRDILYCCRESRVIS